jgi:hypothetical protein
MSILHMDVKGITPNNTWKNKTSQFYMTINNQSNLFFVFLRRLPTLIIFICQLYFLDFGRCGIACIGPPEI